MLWEERGELEKAKKDYGKLEKINSELASRFLKEKKDILLEPFPVKNRLCNLFPKVELKLSATQSHPKLFFKLSFSMPFIKPPNMIPNIEEEML